MSTKKAISLHRWTDGQAHDLSLCQGQAKLMEGNACYDIYGAIPADQRRGPRAGDFTLAVTPPSDCN